MLKTIYCILLMLLSITGLAQKSSPCSEDSIYHTLDFWLGTWEVYDEEKKTLLGKNSIQKELNGCAITEHWKSMEGGEGRSLFYVDNKTKNWKQVWVTINANEPMGQKEKTLIESAINSVLFEGSYPYNGITLLDRTRLTELPSGDVKQEIMISSDAGKNWRTIFMGTYQKEIK